MPRSRRQTLYTQRVRAQQCVCVLCAELVVIENAAQVAAQTHTTAEPHREASRRGRPKANLRLCYVAAKWKLRPKDVETPATELHLRDGEAQRKLHNPACAALIARKAWGTSDSVDVQLDVVHLGDVGPWLHR